VLSVARAFESLFAQNSLRNVQSGPIFWRFRHYPLRRMRTSLAFPFIVIFSFRKNDVENGFGLLFCRYFGFLLPGGRNRERQMSFSSGKWSHSFDWVAAQPFRIIFISPINSLCGVLGFWDQNPKTPFNKL